LVFRSLISACAIAFSGLLVVLALSQTKIFADNSAWGNLGVLLFLTTVVTLSIVIILVFMAVNIVALLAIYGTMGLLWIIELLLRRTAEYPKGPILFMSGLLAALFTFLKSLKVL